VSTFIELHGQVKYPVPGYRAQGPCEIRGCADRQQQLAALFRREFGYAAVPISDAEFIERLLDLPEGYGPLYLAVVNPGKIHFEVDHCHKHGWVRGVVCRSCNNKLPVIARPSFDLDFIENHYGIELIKLDYLSYLANCADCHLAGMRIA
jgi:hypothetical protein